MENNNKNTFGGWFQERKGLIFKAIVRVGVLVGAGAFVYTLGKNAGLEAAKDAAILALENHTEEIIDVAADVATSLIE